jgi:lipopolysaccharide transport system ATP-binding protein
MSSDSVIKIENLSKCYQIYSQPRDRLKQFLLPRLRQLLKLKTKNYFHEFWAIDGVSFEVKRGETVGIIGRNGCGKSTLLQMICGTLNPTGGIVETKGRIAALLELGSGFNPEFTGRENVYLNATLLGLSRAQIDSRFDEITTFADIGNHMEQPVKNYSSGMYVRLAFAVIAHIDADILIVDEALSVGDVFFQQKCMRFLRNFRENGGSLLFVSHDISTVMALCDRAVLISKDNDGKHFYVQGNTKNICQLFLRELYADPSRTKFTDLRGTPANAAKGLDTFKKNIAGNMSGRCRYLISGFKTDAEWFGDHGGKILYAQFQNSAGEPLTSAEGDQKITLAVTVQAHKLLMWPAVGIILKDRQGQSVFTESTDPHFREFDLTMQSGETREILFNFRMPCLIRGNYTLDLAFANGIGDDHVQQQWLHDPIRIECVEGRQVHGIAGLSDLEIFWN